MLVLVVLADAVPVVVWMVGVGVLGCFVGGGLDFGLKLQLSGVGFFRSVCVVVIVIVRGIVGIVAIAIAIAIVIVVMVRLRRRRRRLLLLTSLLRFIPSGLENVLPISTNPAQCLLLLLTRQSRRSTLYYALIHPAHRALIFILVIGHVGFGPVILPCT